MTNLIGQPALSFSLDEYEARITKVRALMRDQGIDVLLVHQFPNLCYLSGYQSFNNYNYYVLIVPLEGEPALVLWASELGNAHLTSWITRTYTFPTRGDPVALTINLVNEYGLGRSRIGLELDSANLNVRSYHRIVNAFPQATFVDCSGLVQKIRVIKSPQEIAHMRRASSITALGMQAAVECAQIGSADHDMAAAAYQALIGGGSEYMCLQPVVSAGKLSGVPHSNHRGIVLQGGNTVLLEMSACVHRYNAPLMRAVVLGEPEDTVRRMADACLTTLNEVIATMIPGRTFHEVAMIGEAAIVKAGPSMIFHHTFAYSVGLGFPPTWADCPVTIVQADETVVQPGMVFHLPISLRDAGRYGVALSETVAITETGNEVLTHLDRQLFHR